MAVKIRLARRGRKKLALYDVVVSDSRSSRGGKFIEKIGTYNPNTNPATVVLNDERAFHWIMVGALPTDTARTILSHKGLLLKRHLQLGVLKNAISQEQADKKLNEWLEAKQKSTDNVDASFKKAKEDAKKAKLAAETEKNKAKAEAIAKKNTPPVVEEAPAAEEAPVAEETTTEAPAEGSATNE
ncbi:MAG TPA: 30S ribosomal protein S16 [Cytophagales bacterium]|nr:30S ribosomal protein S16 [Cytophagales bacterium]